MCTRVQCPKCKKPTFAGCGAHVEMVLGNVPTDQRCRCREAKMSDKPAPSSLPWWRLGR